MPEIYKRKTTYILRESDEYVLQKVKEFIIQNNAYTKSHYGKLGFISPLTLKTRFKFVAWRDFLYTLGLAEKYDEAVSINRFAEKTVPTFVKQIVDESNEELLEKYKTFSSAIGAKNGASIEDMKKYNFKYSHTVYLRRFGSWEIVKKMCGYTFNLGAFYTKEEVFELLKKARLKYGRRLSQKEVTKDKDLPAIDTVQRAFKTTKLSEVWDLIEDHLGLARTTNIYVIEKNEITPLLRKEYQKFGRPLTLNEIRENKNLPGLTTILRRFNTTKLSEVWEEVIQSLES